MGDIYIGDNNGIARKVSNVYVGDANGIARKVQNVYIGDANGIARLVWTAIPPYNPPTDYNARAGMDGGGEEDGREYAQTGNNNCYASYNYSYKELYYTHSCSVSCEITVPSSVLNTLRANGYTRVQVNLYGYKDDYESSPSVYFRVSSNGSTVYSDRWYDASVHNHVATYNLPSTTFKVEVSIGTISELAYREGIYCSAQLAFVQ